jgi:hypothetical protein
VTPGFRVPYLVSSFDPETGENGLIVYTQPAGEDKAAAAKAHFVRSSLHTKFRAK